MSKELMRATEAYAAKLNARPNAREQLEDDEYEIFEEDLTRDLIAVWELWAGFGESA